ncbi:MAG: copper chaperone PCu(A)C [Devosia sp.]
MSLIRSAALAVLVSVAMPTLASAHNGLEHQGCPTGQVFTAGDLSITGAFTRAMLPGARTAGGYLVIENKGSSADRLLGGSSLAAGTIQMHQMSVVDGVMKMGAVDGGLDIPAGGSVTLGPGGFHLMMMDIGTPFKEGECLEIKLQFETAGEVPVVLNIGGVAQDAPPEGEMAHDMSGMDMSGMSSAN